MGLKSSGFSVSEGPGFFVSPTGEVHRVTTHLAFCRDHPEVADLTPEEARSLTEDDRPRVLRAALERGWIRLRFQQDGLHIELWKLDDEARERIRKFLERDGAWVDDRVLLGELANNTQTLMTAGDFLL